MSDTEGAGVSEEQSAPAAGEQAAAAEQQVEPAAAADRDDTREKARGKVDLLLKAAGDAPIMKKRRWQVEPEKTVGWVVQFIRRYLKLDPADSLYVYVSQAFSPAPDQTMGNLFQCFGFEGKLILHYCKTQAWG